MPREHELLETIAAGRWPDATDATLVAHVPSCTVCSEMVLVAGALRGDYDHVCGRTCRLQGSSGGRSVAGRREAGMAARPITMPMPTACSHGWLHARRLALAVASRIARWVDAASRLADVGRLQCRLLLAVGAWLILAPVVLFLVLSEE